jgi:seryl-tRNA synthetase
VLDIRLIRENPDAVNTALKRRNPGLSVDEIVELDAQRRKLLSEEETLRAKRNQMTPQIAEKKKAGENADALQAEAKTLAERIKDIEQEKDLIATKQNTLLMELPNLPCEQTPTGKDETENIVVRTWGDEFKSRPHAEVLDHWDIGSQLGILDFERGVKVAQSRFTLVRGLGAKLERALISLMLDVHSEAGYEELLPPFLVNRDAMTGTGQLPKFEADMFRCKDDELYLVPTAEVPVTNLYRGEVLDEAQLPMNLTAYTPCFRREAGSAGKDTRGLIRQHQFNKVELVKLVHPSQSELEHQLLVTQAEKILQVLELPYRVVELCSGDIGFSAARCYDLEVWMPAQGVYREISSCSNFKDFQARRAGLKFKDSQSGKQEFVHTLNGSGLAVGRTLAAILENYQISKAEVLLPGALHPYLKNIQQKALLVSV